MTARDTALAALVACRQQKAWSDGILKSYIGRAKLSRRDAALTSRLCYGVLQNRMLLDYEIRCLLQKPKRKLHPLVQDILLLGAYQLLFMDRIPHSAAIDEAVKQTKRLVNQQAAGLVNGLLRAMSRTPPALPADLATRYSHPRELVELLCRSVGEEKLEAVLQANNEIAPTCIQVNTLKITAAALQEKLQQAGADPVRHAWMTDCLLLEQTGTIDQMPAFREGLFYVQDPAAKLAALCTDAQPGMTVLDACAAPGGKSFACAILMNNQGRVLSCDIHAHKLPLIEKGAARLGLSALEVQRQDAAVLRPEWEGKMDVVLADVPCSGLGVIRKKPDIRYKDLQTLSALPQLQLRILKTQAAYVKAGGVLLYSTCTLNKEENEDIIHAFLQQTPGYTVEKLPLPPGLQADNNGMLTLLPSEHACDGFFICRLRKSN